MNQSNERISNMYSKGYRANDDGTIRSPFSKQSIAGSIGKGGYKWIVTPRPNRGKVKLHRFIAYCKYGSVMFREGMVVRHLNNDKWDNSIDNIVIGTVRDNALDNPVEKRIKIAAKAARKYQHLVDIILELNEWGVPDALIRENLGIPKSTLSYIINGKSYNVREVDYYPSTGKRRKSIHKIKLKKS